MAQAGSLYTSLTLESASFISGLKKAAEQTGASTASIEKNLNLIVGAGKAVLGGQIANELLQVGRRALDYASSLGEVSQQLGVTSGDLQVFRAIATQVGVSQEEMDKGLQKLTRTIAAAADGAKEPVELFRRLGVSIRDSNGNILDAGKVLPRLADGIAALKTPVEQGKAAFEAFGKTGQQLVPLLAGGSAAIDEMTASFAKFGIVLSPEQIARADDAADTLSKLNKVLEAKLASVVADNAGAIITLANAFLALADGAGKAITKLVTFGLVSRTHNPFVSTSEQNAAADTLLTTPEGRRARYLDLKERRDAEKRAFEGNHLKTQGDIDAYNESQRTYAREFKRIIAASAAPSAAANGTADGIGRGGYEKVNDKGAGAKALARAEEEARKKALRQEDAFQNELGRDQDQYLSLRVRLTSDVREQAQYEHDAIDHAAAARDAGHDRDVAEGKLTAARAAELKIVEARNDDLEHAAVNRRLDAALDAQDLAAKLAGIDNQRDILSAQDALATSSGDRRDIELRLLDLQIDEERARQEAVLASRDSTEAEKQIATARLGVLGALRDSGRERVRRDTAGAGETYLRKFDRTAGQIADDLETSGVSALERFNASLDDSVKKTLHLHGIFGDIIGDLVDMAIKQAIIKPLATSLFGDGGGGILGSVATLFSGKGFANGGRPPTGMASLVGERGPELFIPDVAGTVVSNAALRGGGGGTINQSFDLRGALVDRDVYADINRISASHAQQAAIAMGSTLIGQLRQGARPTLPVSLG